MTNDLEQIAIAALGGDGLLTRSLLQDWLAGRPNIETLPPPSAQDLTIRALTAALAELMALRLGQNPPPWAASVGPAPAPIHLLKSAERMKGLRRLCEESSPSPLRSRRFYAPANYLSFV